MGGIPFAIHRDSFSLTQINMHPYVLFLILVKLSFLLIIILQKAGVLKKNAPISVFVHQLFLASFAVFMLWIFRPTQKSILVRGEVKFLLFLFAILVLFDVKWEKFWESTREIF